MKRDKLLFLFLFFLPYLNISAEQASLKLDVFADGVSVNRQTKFELYPQGSADLDPKTRGKYILTRYCGVKSVVDPGVYDLRVRYKDGHFDAEKWYRDFSISKQVEKKVNFLLNRSTLKVVVTRDGKDLGHRARWAIYAPGEHQKALSKHLSGYTLALKKGTYDLLITSKEGKVVENKWLYSQEISGDVVQQVPLSNDAATLRVIIKNFGKDLKYNASWVLFKPGVRDKMLAKLISGGSYVVQPGFYDLKVQFKKDGVEATRWLRNIYLSKGENLKEIDLQKDYFELEVKLSDNLAELKSNKVQCQVFIPVNTESGKHLTYATPDSQTSLEAGTYDIFCKYTEQDQNKIKIGAGWKKAFELKHSSSIRIDLSLTEAELNDYLLNQPEDKSLKAEEFKTGQPNEIQVQVLQDDQIQTGYNFEVYKDDGSSGELLIEAKGGSKITLYDGLYKFKVYQAEAADGELPYWFQKININSDLNLNLDLNLKLFNLTVADDTEPQSKKRGTEQTQTNIEIVFDASGSMWGQINGQRKIEIAKKVLSDVLKKLPSDNLQLALRVYGQEPKSRKNCQDSKLLAPLGKLTAKELLKEVKNIKPSGYTPIAYSLEQAAKDFPKGENNALILITDGIESCQGDPCAVSAGLANAGLNTQAFVVGFGLEQEGVEVKGSLDCIGKYFSASNSNELNSALDEVFRKSLQSSATKVIVFRSGKREQIVASASAGEAIQLPIGYYDVVVNSGQGQKVHTNVKLNQDLVLN